MDIITSAYEGSASPTDSNPSKYRHTLTVLNLLLNYPSSRKLLATKVSEERETRWPGLPDFPDQDDDSYSFWFDMMDSGEIDYYVDGNSDLFATFLEKFTYSEACTFIEEQYRPYENTAAEQAVARHDFTALRILGDAGWARMPDCIVQATATALIHGPGLPAIATLQVVLDMVASKSDKCRQIYIFGGDWRFVNGMPDNFYREECHTITVFELCSMQPPNSENAVLVLRMLLTSLKKGNKTYPVFAVHLLRVAFVAAMKTAIAAKTSVRLGVLETYLDLCENLLVPRGDTQWKVALETRNAIMLRGICMEVCTSGGTRGDRRMWRLKEDASSKL